MPNPSRTAPARLDQGPFFDGCTTSQPGLSITSNRSSLRITHLGRSAGLTSGASAGGKESVAWIMQERSIIFPRAEAEKICNANPNR